MALSLNKYLIERGKIRFNGKEHTEKNSLFLAVIKFPWVEAKVLFIICRRSFIITNARKDNGEEKIIQIEI